MVGSVCPAARRTFFPATLLLLLTAVGSAADFRVETSIRMGDGERPLSRNLTLFSGGVIYDFLLGDNEEITIFDTRSQTFRLLDTGRKLQTLVQGSDVADQLARHRTRARKADKFARFLADPQLSTIYNANTGQLRLTSKVIRYRFTTTKALQQEDAHRYRVFSDAFARLNAVRRGGIPPFARLQANSELANRGLVPATVELELTTASGRVISAVSRHRVVWKLLDEDIRRIDSLGSLQNQFRTVDFDRYVRSERTARR